MNVMHLIIIFSSPYNGLHKPPIHERIIFRFAVQTFFFKHFNANSRMRKQLLSHQCIFHFYYNIRIFICDTVLMLQMSLLYVVVSDSYDFWNIIL